MGGLQNVLGKDKNIICEAHISNLIQKEYQILRLDWKKVKNHRPTSKCLGGNGQSRG